MKSQFAHYKSRATGFGMRGLAVMLCFVMLLTAIGAGTMMTAFSAKADLTGSTAIADTAQKVVDIANSVDTKADDGIIPKITKKITDLADTGARVDIAETGYNKLNVYTSASNGGTYSYKTNFSGNSGSFTLTLTANEDIYFYLQGDTGNDYYGGDFTLPYNSAYNMGKYYNSVSNVKKIHFQATNGGGTYTFTVTDVTASPTITATGGDGTSGGDDDDDDAVAVSTTTMLVSAWTDSGSGYYASSTNGMPGLHMWNSSDSSQIEATQYATMTYANYGGVAYYKPTDSKIKDASGNYIKFAFLTSTSSWSGATEYTNASNFKKGTQWVVWNTSSSGTGTSEAFTPITIQKVTSPSEIIVNTNNSMSLYGTGGFPWFYYVKLNNTGEGKKYKLTVKDDKGNTLVNNKDYKYSDEHYDFTWKPTSTGSYTLTYTLSDNDSIDSVTYTKTYTVKEPLTTPTITIDGESGTSTSTQQASTSLTSPILVTNTNSYSDGTIFKLYRSTDSGTTYTLVDSNTSGIFSVARNTGTAGKYKVVAVPSASDTTHSNSADSNIPTLSITKIAAPTAPTLSSDKIVINQGGKVTLTVGNYNDYSADVLANYDLKLYKTTNTSSTATTVTTEKATMTSASYIDVPISSGSNTYAHYKARLVAKDSTIYNNSDYSTTTVNVNVVTSHWYAYGDEPFSASGKTWNQSDGATGISDYYEGRTFYHVFHCQNTTDDPAFRLTSSSSYKAYPNAVRVSAPSTSTLAAYANQTDTTYCWEIKGYTTYVLFVTEAASNPATSKPYVWVRTDMSEVTVTPKYQDMDLSTGKYGAAATDDGTRISANIDSTIVTNGQTLTLIAAVNNADYEFVGWYDANDFTGDPLSTDLTYTTSAISASKTYYPLVRQKVNKYNVIVGKNDNADVKAEWNSRTAQNGRTLSNVPAGATVKLTATAHDGYSIDTISWADANGNKGTVTSGGTFTMPEGNVTVTVTTKPDKYFWYHKGITDTTKNEKVTPINPSNTGNSYWTYGEDIDVDKVDGKYVAKIPASYFNSTYYSTLCFSNSKDTLFGQMFYLSNSDQGITFNYGNATTQTCMEAYNHKYYIESSEWGNLSDRNYYYVKAKFRSSTYLANAKYVLLEADTDNRKYTLTLVSDDSPATVNFIAKDGATRGTSGATGVAKDEKTLGAIGSTKVTLPGSSSAIGTQATFSTYTDNVKNQYYTGSLTAGTTYKIRTTVSDNRYYVKAFNVNGVSVAVLNKPASPAAGAEYSCEYTVPANSEGTLEIIPVYYLYDDSDCVTFYLEGYDESIQEGLDWGATPYIYPFYATKNNTTSGGSDKGHNVFGAYAGQPMVFAEGKYEIQIPVTNVDLCTPTGSGNENSTNIKGITINNGYYDAKHAEVMGWSSDDNHRQTYDFDDFHKIYEEKNPTDIYFKIKLREDRDNSATYRHTLDTTLTAVDIADIRDNGNRWELLQDRYNRTIGLFGDPLSGTALEADPLYVISTGYNANTAGSYGTSWQVYHKTASGYELVRDATNNVNAIPPSLLFINEVGNLAKSVYPINTYTNDKVNTTTIDPGIYGNPQTYSTLYTTLKNNYSGVPVYISYEMNDKTTPSNYGGSGDTTYGAWRLDGRWYYTTAKDKIISNIEIQYIDGAAGYIAEETPYEVGYDGELNQGAHTGAQAFFTDTDYDYYAKVKTDSIPSDKTKNFTMQANPAEGYEFVGWFIKSDDSYTPMNPTDVAKTTASTSRSTGFTFVARYKKLTNFNLSITDTVSTGTALSGNTFNGSGTAAMDIAITTDGSTYTTLASGVTSYTLDKTYLNNTSLTNINLKLKITATGTASGSDAFGEIDNIYNSRYSTTSPYEYVIQLNTLFTAVPDGSGGYEYDQNVMSLPFKTYFTAHEYKYEITYSYPSTRLSSSDTPITQTYTAKGIIKSTMLNSVTEADGTTANAMLTEQFIIDKKPKESNFMKDMDFRVITRPNQTTSGTVTTYTATAAYTINDTDSGKMSVTLNLPYAITSRTKGSYDFSAADGVAYDNTFATISFTVAQGYGNYLSSTGVKATSASGLLTAPATVIKSESGSDVTKYFSYWKMTDTSGQELARVYNREFNYRLFNNCALEPIFNSDSEETHALADTEILVSIDYQGTTRNQWNNNGNGGYVAGTAAQDKASDILFNDFEVAYTYKGKELRHDNNATCGVILQKVGVVEQDSNEEYITDMAYYADKYSSSLTSDADKIKTFIGNENKGGLTLQKYDDLSGNLNNKNRMNFYYASYNSYGWDDTNNVPTSNRTVKMNVYRAYTYMTYSGDSNVYLSEPVYFSMYETAETKEK